jgi:hypothetical protein
MALIKTEVEGILRDTNNGALLNRDNDALMAYKKQKNRQVQMENKLNHLENELSDIKNLLLKLVEKDK